jgi:hypothetical protein
MIDISTESNIAIYERIREAVIEDATRPLNGDVEQHRSNIRLLLLNLDYISTQFLASYFNYYHRSRTHLSLGKDTPVGRPVQPAGGGKIVAFPQVGGLHHRYERLAA